MDGDGGWNRPPDVKRLQLVTVCFPSVYLLLTHKYLTAAHLVRQRCAEARITAAQSFSAPDI